MIAYWVAYIFWSLLGFAFFSLKVHGRKNIPANNSFIIASNHLSNLDPMILGVACRRPLNYMAKESLFKNKILSSVITFFGAFPIKRNSGDVRAIKEALRRLKQNKGMVLFPEGTRGAQKPEKKAQPGIGFLAVKSRAVVIPAYIRGSDKVLAPGKKFFKRAPITIWLGSPMQFPQRDDYMAISDKVIDSIYSLP